MRIVKLIAILLVALVVTAYAEETKTFPGAEIIVPALIGQVLPIIIGGIIGGGGGPKPPALPPVSVSHTTSLATSVANRPIAVSFNSHSGSLSTNLNTNAGSHATAGTGSMVAASSATGTSPLQSLSKRWQKLFNNLG
ncbi:uncharacterized protein LOC131426897 isoform X1 [Malaya genurostris]|uniref:uncharacterized protein LOC131426897 isoform X1 n=1 Tax=Malaya genurostris TaxID=325434 RepID=UPI0026F3F22E|nr:uncharacterized protein LOC131426897 isoform X1 [Malaya genurostris]